MRKEYFIKENIEINDEKRDIVVYGKLINQKIPMSRTTELFVESSKSTIIEEYTVKRKMFTVGYSVCHPDDSFDMSVGVSFAKERALNNPINTVMFEFGDCISERVLDEILYATIKKIIKTIKKENKI